MTPLAAQVRDIYEQSDRATSDFAQASGITCPPGCGACCQSPHVEASELEMLPMAEHLVATGEAESIHRQLADRPGDEICLFFQAVPGSSTDGRCGRYSQRPLVCRLFGYSGRLNKNGRPQFTACTIHQQSCPTAVQATVDRVNEGTLRPPLYSDSADALWTIHPTMGTERYPINQALLRVLEQVLMRAQYPS